MKNALIFKANSKFIIRNFFKNSSEEIKLNINSIKVVYFLRLIKMEQNYRQKYKYKKKFILLDENI